MQKSALVIHSGGMDSSLCLALAIQEFQKENVLSLSFSYSQRHQESELTQAAIICREWGVDHQVLVQDSLPRITHNALTDHTLAIEAGNAKEPNTLVVGRNGLMARLGAIYAHHLGAHCIYMGIMEREGANSGYRDCSRAYMDLKQQILRLDLADPTFEIRTPLVYMTKYETMQLAEQLGVLKYLLSHTITCYAGLPGYGCGVCPACGLRNEGVADYQKNYPAFVMPY